MKRIIYYFKKDIVLTVSWVLAAASAFLVRPDKGYVVILTGVHLEYCGV